MKPVRWLEGGDDVPDGARALLESGAPIPSLGPDAHARGVEYAARLASPKLAAWSLSKGVLLFSVVAFVAPSIAVLANAAEPRSARLAPFDSPAAMVVMSERSETHSAPAPPTLEVGALPSASSPAIVRGAASIARPVAPRLSSAAEDTSDTLAREAKLLEGARKELAPDPRGALAILEEHARTFPRGALAVEREFLAVRALERLDRRAEAEMRARLVIENHPNSPYALRLKSLLAPTPAPEAP